MRGEKNHGFIHFTSIIPVAVYKIIP